jgi:Ras-related GTP-binding protein C/D
MDFQVWDFPGHLDYFDSAFDTADIFSEIGALIWVIDAQDDYFDAVGRLNLTIVKLQDKYPAINIEVFVHKVDGLSDDYRIDTYRDIVHRVQDELLDAGLEHAAVSFHQTSIYDHSIFEAFSKVIQKLIPQLPSLEALLTSLCSNCKMEKAYLFDVLSKIYIASDTSPGDMSSYEICSDYIDVVVDISEIYGWDRGEAEAEGAPADDTDGEEAGNQDAESVIVMERKNGNYLYLKEINKYLALICIMGEDSSSERKALIDYNVGVFQEALKQVVPR